MKFLVLTCRRFLLYLRYNTTRGKATVFNVMDLNKNNVFIRYKDDEEHLRITFCFGDVNIKEREFNFIRNKTELLDVALSRIKTKVLNADVPKRKKQKSPSQALGASDNVNFEIKLVHSGQEVDGNTPNIDAWKSGTLVTVGENQYDVIVNGPEISMLGLPKVILSGFLVNPKLCLDFANREDSTFSWFRAVNKEETKLCEESLVHRSKVGHHWFKVGDTFFYWATVKDVDHQLKLICTPKFQNICGKSEEIISNPVIAGPERCPFEDRLLYTKNSTSPGSVRCVSYNILADAYADTDTAKNELFAHCPAEFLAFEYRKQLFTKEIIGYNADILCLQEVDRKVFHHDFVPVLDYFGLTGIYNEKGGNVIEGLACFFRKTKFRLLHSEGVILREILPSESVLEDIWNKVSENENLKNGVINRTTALQIVLLECLDVPNKQILVANTHLYFHPMSDNIRLIQGAICLRYLEYKMKKFREEMPDIERALIFCGDFNSCPKCGNFQLFTKGYVAKSCKDWASNPEQVVPGMLLKQKFKLGSGCGTPAYTNFTENFNECLDYIFYDRDYFTVSEVVPLPTDEQVKELTALPNKKFPSDHIALVCTLTWKETQSKW